MDGTRSYSACIFCIHKIVDQLEKEGLVMCSPTIVLEHQAGYVKRVSLETPVHNVVVQVLIFQILQMICASKVLLDILKSSLEERLFCRHAKPKRHKKGY